ncbi:MAG: hypothetical protein D8M28_08460 [Proteobacteria bacterium]|nr:hypothetical protein [Pseudomonadota bacterium]
MKKPPSGGFFHGWGQAVDELFQEAFIRRAAGTTRLPFDGLRKQDAASRSDVNLFTYRKEMF